MLWAPALPRPCRASLTRPAQPSLREGGLSASLISPSLPTAGGPYADGGDHEDVPGRGDEGGIAPGVPEGRRHCRGEWLGPLHLPLTSSFVVLPFTELWGVFRHSVYASDTDYFILTNLFSQSALTESLLKLNYNQIITSKDTLIT